MSAFPGEEAGTVVAIRRLRLVAAVLVALAVTLVLLPVQLPAMAFNWPVARRIPQLWYRLVLPFLGIRVSVRGTFLKARPLLVVANHVSWTDILVLGSAAPVAFVAKADMRHWPVVKHLARLARTIFVERERRHKSAQQAGEMALRLAGGDPVALFAEGTTGDGNYLFPFKSALLSAASRTIAETGVDEVFVQPVALVYARHHGLPAGRKDQAALSWIGDEDLAPHLMRIVGDGGVDAEVIVGEAIAFTAGSDRKAVTRELEARVRALMVERRRDAGIPLQS